MSEQQPLINISRIDDLSLSDHDVIGGAERSGVDEDLRYPRLSGVPGKFFDFLFFPPSSEVKALRLRRRRCAESNEHEEPTASRV